ncbi:hypothetical protein ACVGXT_00265, partial [Enterobacter intestinihominis]
MPTRSGRGGGRRNPAKKKIRDKLPETFKPPAHDQLKNFLLYLHKKKKKNPKTLSNKKKTHPPTFTSGKKTRSPQKKKNAGGGG